MVNKKNRKQNIIIGILAIIVIAFGMNACVSKKGIYDKDHTARNSVRWAGVYTGTIPSASGSGINVRLELNYDMTFNLRYEYVEREDTVNNWTGAFEWDKAGFLITLDAEYLPSHYWVGENYIVQLDMEGKKITGDLADHYILKKIL